MEGLSQCSAIRCFNRRRQKNASSRETPARRARPISRHRARRPEVEIIMKWNLALVVAALFAAVNAFAQAPSDRPPPRDPRYDAPPPAENTKIAYADVLRVDPVYDRVQANG